MEFYFKYIPIAHRFECLTITGFNLLVVQKGTSSLCGTGPGLAHILKETDVH